MSHPGGRPRRRTREQCLAGLLWRCALAWKTVVTCGGNTPPGSHFSVHSGWPALHRRSDHNPHDEDTNTSEE